MTKKRTRHRWEYRRAGWVEFSVCIECGLQRRWQRVAGRMTGTYRLARNKPWCAPNPHIVPKCGDAEATRRACCESEGRND